MEGSKLTRMGQVGIINCGVVVFHPHQLLMRSNWKILLSAMVEYVSEGEVEFSDVCTVLKVWCFTL